MGKYILTLGSRNRMNLSVKRHLLGKDSYGVYHYSHGDYEEDIMYKLNSKITSSSREEIRSCINTLYKDDLVIHLGIGNSPYSTSAENCIMSFIVIAQMKRFINFKSCRYRNLIEFLEDYSEYTNKRIEKTLKNLTT